MTLLRKLLPYIILGVVAFFASRLIDHFTDTDDFSEERQELMEEINSWRNKFLQAEREREVLRKENDLLLQDIQQYEIENDTVVELIRDANEERNFTRLDSIGDALLDRLRPRR